MDIRWFPNRKPSLAIRCPECASPTDFIFASYVKVANKHVEYFKKSNNFTVHEKLYGQSGYYNIAIFFHGLANSLENVDDLPEGYNVEMWRQRYWFSSTPDGVKDIGGYYCKKCDAYKKHELSWPEDAYFQIEYKGKSLWAYDRKYALALLSYIESKTRDKTDEKHAGFYGFLYKIPEHFQSAKARDVIVKKLRKILDS